MKARVIILFALSYLLIALILNDNSDHGWIYAALIFLLPVFILLLVVKREHAQIKSLLLSLKKMF